MSFRNYFKHPVTYHDITQAQLKLVSKMREKKDNSWDIRYKMIKLISMLL
jgi:hypothetical protein